jgi:hypothetical protein
MTERTFDPFGMQMDDELVGKRVGESTRFIIPFDPLARGATGSGLEGHIDQLLRNSDGELGAVSFSTSTSVERLRFACDEGRFGDPSNRRVFPCGLVKQSLVDRAATLERLEPSDTRLLWLGK